MVTFITLAYMTYWNCTGARELYWNCAGAGGLYWTGQVQEKITETVQVQENTKVIWPLRRKKRWKLHPEKWKKTIKKKSHAGGEQYVDTKGKITKCKSVGRDCNCRQKCFSKLGDEHIAKLFTELCAIGDTCTQDISCSEGSGQKLYKGHDH